jgi:hypothetical protein
MSSYLPHLAFIGKAGAGKSTAAKIAGKVLPDVQYIAFADKLREVAEALWGEAGLRRGKLQDLGEAVRAIDPDTWVRPVVDEVLNLPDFGDEVLDFDGYTTAVVDDCRYPNEAEALAKLGFVFVRVHAPRAVRVMRLRANGKLEDESQLDHISETALDSFTPHYNVHNDPGYGRDLEERVVEILNRERRAC